MRELIIKLSEGNPGALSICCEVWQRDPLALASIDDLGLRGPDIWVGYKDHCGQDISRFIEAVKGKDAAMMKTIEKERAR